MKPMLLINFKTYERGTGKKALSIAKKADMISKKCKANIVLSVQFADIERVSGAVSVPVFAQHIDPVEPGSHTGWILPQSVKEAGARGTLINHSEHGIDMKSVKACIGKCKELGLVSVCCAATPSVAGKIAGFGPDYIAIEPPELIGGDVSVSQANPGIITKTVEAVKKANPKVKVLCGAGVHCGEDVAKAVELGSAGVLVASAIVKSARPEEVIADLIGGFG
ncbi:MAG: triose-phosphate isomerase [Candidatus Aenigmarchaeota archaeon]|nr:triose-phosphate isomerase [Candidatus Aenigmarchaeota archaeon]